jgi:hypothetical protein
LLKNGGKFASAGRKKNIGGEALAISHRDHEVLLADGAKIELGRLCCVEGGNGKEGEKSVTHQAITLQR